MLKLPKAQRVLCGSCGREDEAMRAAGPSLLIGWRCPHCGYAGTPRLAD